MASTKYKTHFKEPGGGWGYSDMVLICFLKYRLPYFDKLFELCPFIQTVMEHENYVDGFPRGGEGGVSESMNGQGCAILAFELVPKNLIFM